MKSLKFQLSDYSGLCWQGAGTSTASISAASFDACNTEFHCRAQVTLFKRNRAETMGNEEDRPC